MGRRCEGTTSGVGVESRVRARRNESVVVDHEKQDIQLVMSASPGHWVTPRRHELSSDQLKLCA